MFENSRFPPSVRTSVASMMPSSFRASRSRNPPGTLAAIWTADMFGAVGSSTARPSVLKSSMRTDAALAAPVVTARIAAVEMRKRFIGRSFA